MADAVIRGLAGSQQNVYTAIYSALKMYGLESLANNILGYIQEGFSADTIMLQLQGTTEWKQRFVGNEIRRQQGLAVLTPAEYLATEAAYNQLYRSYGIPKGFYDSTADLGTLIGKNVSPSELQSRLDMRAQVVTSGAMTGVLSYMEGHFNITPGTLTAYFIDPQRALPLLQKQVSAATIGAAARTAAGLDLATENALRLAERDVTEPEALAGFADVFARRYLTRQLPGQRGETISNEDLISATFEGDQAAREKVARITGARQAEFGGGSYATTREGITGLRVAGQ